MTPVRIDDYNDRNDNHAWEYSITLSEAASSDWIMIPVNVDNISVAVVFSDTAEAKVQISNDLQATLEAGSGETAFDWTSGAVTVNTEDALVPVSAIRLNVTDYTSGNITLLVRAQ